MTHEFKNLIDNYLNAKEIGLKAVMATVVDLDGSSYRRPGVRMLITENGHSIGAVSGGCVEKEIINQATTVFKTGISKMITYDGRFRLGCEGVLYILIEIFSPETEMLLLFNHFIKKRKAFEINSYYTKQIEADKNIGSVITLGEKQFSFSKSRNAKYISKQKVFKQILKPCLKLVIIGAEHDAAQLSLMANHLGWEVEIVTGQSNIQTLEDFPGANSIQAVVPESLNLSQIDDNTAVVIMTHNYAKDLRFLSVLKNIKPVYLGLLGPSKRREKLLNEFIDLHPIIDDAFFDCIFGPVGLNIGAETPQEIALSICSEILAVTRKKEPKPLKDKTNAIHHNESF